MNEAILSITPAGELNSARYYNITRGTLNRRNYSGELIDEILCRSRDQEGIDWKISFEDLKVDISKKYEYKINFYVSRNVPMGESSLPRALDH